MRRSDLLTQHERDPRPLFYVTSAWITHPVLCPDGRQGTCHTDWTWDFAGRATATCPHARYRQLAEQNLWADDDEGTCNMGVLADDGLLSMDAFLAKVDAVLADCARWQRGA